MYRFSSQNEHDEVVLESAKTYWHLEQQGFKVSVNPGSDKNCSVGESNYPDVVVWLPASANSSTGVTRIIEEIETAESVTDIEAEQWNKYSQIGALFRLIVPWEAVSSTVEILHRKNIRVTELWYYYYDSTNKIGFTKAV